MSDDALKRALQIQQARRHVIAAPRPADAGKLDAILARHRLRQAAPAPQLRTSNPPNAAPVAVASAPPSLAISAPSQTLRLTFAFDATGSRGVNWEAKKRLTNSMIAAIPAQFAVNLAVHGVPIVDVFTDFVTEREPLRQIVKAVPCVGGDTRLLPILARVLAADDVRAVVYSGDCFEESESEAAQLGAALGLRGIRFIFVHDSAESRLLEKYVSSGTAFFRCPALHAMARHTGGTVLSFDRTAPRRLRKFLLRQIPAASTDLNRGPMR
jgi:hypothetical protein